MQHHRLPPHQPLEVIGQLGGCWQGCAADQDPNHADVAGQRPGKLQAHIVVGLEQAGSALRSCRGQPAQTDDRQDRVTVVEGAINRRREVLARGNGHHVLEHAVGTQALAERVGQAPGVPWDITAPVAQEDLHRTPPSHLTGVPVVPRQHSKGRPVAARGASRQARHASQVVDLRIHGRGQTAIPEPCC